MFSTVACLLFLPFGLLVDIQAHASGVNFSLSLISIMRSKGCILRTRDDEYQATQSTITHEFLNHLKKHLLIRMPELQILFILGFYFLLSKAQISAQNFQHGDLCVIQV